MTTEAGLDRAALARWCQRHLGSEPERVLFESGYLSQVIGVRLVSGRDVVVKTRAWQDRLVGCGRVQQRLFTAGFPAPEVLVAADRVDALGLSAEAMVPGGELLPAGPDSAARFADALAALVRSAPETSDVGSLTPAPAWVGWDHPGQDLWPAPDDRDGDLNKDPQNGWLNEIGAAARDKLKSLPGPVVVGHGDWYSQNLRWIDRQLLVVHDWDSVIAQPEAAIAGQAAAIWPGTGLPGEVASIEESDRFLDAYQQSRGRPFADQEVQAAWAAGLWTRAFDAKKASLVGADPDAALTRSEANERCRFAGL